MISETDIPVIPPQACVDLIDMSYRWNPDKFLLIQIGANDGIMCDRMADIVRKYDARAIMLEPIPCYFEKLKENHAAWGNQNVSFEQAALDTKIATRTMNYIPESRFEKGEIQFRIEGQKHLYHEHWARGLGSFYDDKTNIACPELQQYVETAEVPTTTWKALIEKYDITKEHNVVVQTDCEGHDIELLRNFDFGTIRPLIYISEIFSMIRYPVTHPRYKPHPVRGMVEYQQDGGIYTVAEAQEAYELFSDNSYDLLRDNDLIALDRDHFVIEHDGEHTHVGLR